MNFRSEVGGEAQHTDPPWGPLVPPHKILKVVTCISAHMLSQMAPPVRHPSNKIPCSCKMLLKPDIWGLGKFTYRLIY